MADQEAPTTRTRREVLRAGGAALVGGAVAGGAVAVASSVAGASPRIPPADGPARRYAMIIDLRRCVKCESCTVACKAENNIPVDSSRRRSRRILWNHLVYEEDSGSRPTIHAVPQPCNHCENPPCTKVCPVGATYRDKSRGIVMQNYDICIGCRYCTVACPYTRRYFNWETPSFPHLESTGVEAMSGTRGAQNPMVQVRSKGVTEKCVFCIHRILAAETRAQREGRVLRDGDVKPACVTTCIAQARIFGDLNDPESEISRLYEEQQGKLVRLQEDLGTEPNVFYIPEEVWPS